MFMSIFFYCFSMILQTDSQVVIRLFTAKNVASPVIINSSTSLSNVDGFNNNITSQNYMIVHGWNSNGELPWVLEMKTKLFSADSANANVFTIDWRVGANTDIDYPQAIVNLEAAVTEVHTVIASLKEDIHFKNGLFNIHCIGHR